MSSLERPPASHPTERVGVNDWNGCFEGETDVLSSLAVPLHTDNGRRDASFEQFAIALIIAWYGLTTSADGHVDRNPRKFQHVHNRNRLTRTDYEGYGD